MVQLTQQSSFAGWDFLGERSDGTSEVWMPPEDSECPALSVLRGRNAPVPPGSGTAQEPYLVQTEEALGAVVYRPHAQYRLEKDLDLTGIEWSTPIVPALMGEFDGCGRTIARVTLSSGGCSGLFGQVCYFGAVTDL